MKTLIVWPKFDSFSFWHFEKVCELVGARYMTPPLGLLTVAALLPKDWDLRLVDENVRPLEEADLDWADHVLMGSKITHRARALDIIARVKARGLKITVGGPDPTLSTRFYEEAGADFFVLNEGEVTVPMWLADLERGATSGKYLADQLADLSLTPCPRFDLIDHRDYLYVGVQYSRGCPYHCEFCNVIDLFSNKYRTKTLEQVLTEFQCLYDLGYRGQLDFFDDNLVGHLGKAKPFLRGIAEWGRAHGWPFMHSTSVTLNIAKDPELLGLLREARFKALLIGIETPDEDALKSAQKQQNTGFSIAEAVDAIYRQAGATVHSGFLLGMDGEPDDIRAQIIQCIEETSVPWVMPSVVYPLPETQLARRLAREGRLFPKARGTHDKEVRDQISAGIMFKPERSPAVIVDDLLAIMKHSFEPANYFARCRSVALRLDTIPALMPSWFLLKRNVRAFGRLCVAMTRDRGTRTPFWRSIWTVLLRNPRGIEALAMLSILFVHFQSILPYCYEQLEKQQRELAAEGDAAWLARNLAEPGPPEPDPELQLSRPA
jgi:radical SAM superfamily enzyme YgiQ (UPF0313 family)